MNNTKQKAITLITYSPKQDDDFIDFDVTYEWLEKTLQEDNVTVEEFLNEYTWDWSEGIYNQAKDENAILIYHTDCENCEAIIKASYTENSTTDVSNYTVCDSCEATICVDCISEFNECPVCGREITAKENF